MAFWIAMAVLAAAASIPLLVVLGRPAPAAPSTSSQAFAIYRDQLDELGRDVARGSLPPSEADAARTEIARRLIREGEAIDAPKPVADRGRQLAAVAVIAMPLLALASYLVVGSPVTPDMPLASRPDALALQDVTRLVAQVEARLAASPNDGHGWEVVAPVYQRLGRNADAINAWTRAIVLLGSTADREISLGEAMVQASNGAVTPDASAAFEKALALAPEDSRARFYLALGLTQAGRTDDAKAAWQALIANAPADATWLPAARMQLATLGAPGPNASDVEAANDMTPADRQQMIEGMVASLADRLKAEPGDADGWARLIRSYMVLGRQDNAATALASARLALAGDTAKLATVEAAARESGVTGANP